MCLVKTAFVPIRCCIPPFAFLGSMNRPLSCALLALAVANAAADPLVVATSCGPVEGLWQTVSSTERVASWKGIPYATPPVGALRWRPPTALTCWSGTFNASNFGNVCYQYGMGSEDCLSLNVFVPEAVANGSVASAPVFAYIHGGGLTGGASAFEQVAALSAHAQTGIPGGGAVIVTFNYRLNIFGWLTTEELTADGGGHNFGLQDMQLALQWIQTNIKGASYWCPARQQRQYRCEDALGRSRVYLLAFFACFLSHSA